MCPVLHIVCVCAVAVQNTHLEKSQWRDLTADQQHSSSSHYLQHRRTDVTLKSTEYEPQTRLHMVIRSICVSWHP